MGFFEILLIAIVTLLVVGPERMPEAVRTVALTIGRIKRSFNSARSEIEKQIGADEIRRQLHNEDVMASLGKIKEGLSDIDKQIDADEIDMPWTEEDHLKHSEEEVEDEENYYEYDPNHHQNHKCENKRATVDSESENPDTEKKPFQN